MASIRLISGSNPASQWIERKIKAGILAGLTGIEFDETLYVERFGRIDECRRTDARRQER